MRSIPACFFIALILSVSILPATDSDARQSPHAVVQDANYDLAERFAPYVINDYLYSTSIRPQWIEGTEKFWYEWETSDGSEYRIVDPSRGSQQAIFDNDALAAEITRITKDPYDGKHLPIRSIKFLDGNTLQFEVESSQDEEIEDSDDDVEEDDMEEDGDRSEDEAPGKKIFYFEWKIDSQTLRELDKQEEPDDHPSWASVAPNGSWVVFARHHNLYKISGEDYQKILDARRGLDGDEADEAADSVDVDEIQLTEDGEEFFSYEGSVWRLGQYHGQTQSEVEESKDDRKGASIVWSPDSKRFTVERIDLREVGDLWVVHNVGNERPELETYKYSMPGEENVEKYYLHIIDLESGDQRDVQADLWQDQQLSMFQARQFRYPDTEEPYTRMWLTNDPGQFLLYRHSRDQYRADVLRADAATGEVEVVIEERMNTYVEVRPPELLSNGDLVWWSERDGWAHLYRFDKDGTLKNRLTDGPWSVRYVSGVNENESQVFFQANGRENGEDPYYQHLYRVDVDGSELRLVSPGNYDHRTRMTESARYFVDNYSRVNTIPAAVLRDADGRRILELAEADFSRLFEAGYQFPEPYVVKAADGITDLYGVMYKPFDFDSTRSYPLVEYVYPGPQTEAVSKSFSTNRYETALAQFGMVVVTVGNRGGHPARSKWYHTYGYGNLRDYGLADKKAAAEQLAYRHDFIDADRIGIYGHSGGGFMSTAAMLVYPDFFKVAVSSAGNHTNEIYNRNWSEKHHGIEEVVSDSGDVSFEYDIASNPELAKNLKGHLLLTTGDVDNNVHPANTIRMANALIRANKRFDFFIFPGQRHGFGNMSDYWFWLRAEYFVEHLLGDDRWSVDITELNNRKPRTR